MRLAVVLLSLAFRVQEEAPDDAKIRSLIDQLGADFLEEREPARKALEKAGKAAEPRLVDGLSNPDHRVRRACLELLTPLKSTSALRRATDLFAQDDDAAVRESAFHLLQALGREAEDAIIGALSSPNPEFRKGAVQSLSELRSQKAVTRIAELLDREADAEVKKAAWKCLLASGKPAEPYLRKFLRDPDPALRRDALQSLNGSTEPETVTAIAALFAQETDDAPLDQAYQFLVASPTQAEPSFLAGLKNPRQPTRLKSIMGLKATKNPKGLDPVGELFLGDSPPDVRNAAADYLKSLGTAAEPLLLKGLDAKESAVRLAAIQALGDIESEKALEPIGKLFREEKNQEVHERCFEFLRRLGIRAQAHLLAALSDENKELRCQAIIALGEAKSEEAIPRLLEFMTELDPRMREASEEALALIGPKAIEQVKKAVADGRVRKSAAEAIEANFVRIEVERVLEAQLGDDEYTGFYEGQFRELQTFGRERAMPVLIRILSERSYIFRRSERHVQVERFRGSMRELAVMALGELGGEEALQAVKNFANTEDFTDDSKRRIHEEAFVALHRLGDRKPLEDYLRDIRHNADVLLRDTQPGSKEKGVERLFSLGLLMTRLRRYDEATQVYNELLAVLDRNKLQTLIDSYNTTCYNLACLYSQKGEKRNAVEWLEKAVRAGFKERSWIRKDRDLDNIREEEGYKKLLADDKLFEKIPADQNPGDK